MELHPEIRDDTDPFTRRVRLTCKYRAPEPLMIKFVVGGVERRPFKHANESVLFPDGWHGELVLESAWAAGAGAPAHECRTLTARGATLGVLTADLREDTEPPSEGSPLERSLRYAMPPSRCAVAWMSNTHT